MNTYYAMKIKSILGIIMICLTFSSCAQDKNKVNTNHNYQIVVKDLINPWGFTFLPDQSILINEKDGRLIHFKDSTKKEIKGLSNIYVRGQGGLLDIKLDPDYKENNWIYFSLASTIGDNNGGNTAIIRGKLDKDSLNSIELLYKATPNTTKGQHFGSRIIFKEDKLFFSIGERGERDINPQDINKDGGKIYRINKDGSIPKDNPFINEKNAKHAIWSYGHRNPQGLTIHPTTNQIWSHEHGPRGGDEINIIKKGANYGWPIITYGVNYSGTKITDKTSKKDMEQPIHYWDPSIAPSGMVFINSDKYGDWNGHLLVGSLKFQYLNLCKIKDNKVISEEKLLDGLGRVRSIVQGPDGYIYVGIENLGIVKLIKQ